MKKKNDIFSIQSNQQIESLREKKIKQIMYIKFDAVLYYRMVICVEQFSVGIYKYINEKILFLFCLYLCLSQLDVNLIFVVLLPIFCFYMYLNFRFNRMLSKYIHFLNKFCCIPFLLVNNLTNTKNPLQFETFSSIFIRVFFLLISTHRDCYHLLKNRFCFFFC